MYENPVTTVSLLDQSDAAVAFYNTFKNLSKHEVADLGFSGPYIQEFILNKVLYYTITTLFSLLKERRRFVIA